jgi:hypothetical protein
MSRVFIEKVRLGPFGLTTGSAELVGTIPISKFMAGLASGSPLSMCQIDMEYWGFGGADIPNVYSRHRRATVGMGLDGSTYLLGDVTHTELGQGNSDHPLFQSPGITCDIDGSDFRVFGTLSSEETITPVYMVVMVTAVRAFTT